MKHLKNYLLIPMLLGGTLTGSAVAQNDPVRVAAVAIPLEESRASKGVLAEDELFLSRRLIEALERENAELRSRLDTERSANAILLELNETRKSESDALRETVKAKNETIAAKDSAIVAQDKLIAGLRTKRTSIWKRIGDIAIGAAVGALLR